MTSGNNVALDHLNEPNKFLSPDNDPINLMKVGQGIIEMRLS
jgi:hypothetical protein